MLCGKFLDWDQIFICLLVEFLTRCWQLRLLPRVRLTPADTMHWKLQTTLNLSLRVRTSSNKRVREITMICVCCAILNEGSGPHLKIVAPILKTFLFTFYRLMFTIAMIISNNQWRADKRFDIGLHVNGGGSFTSAWTAHDHEIFTRCQTRWGRKKSANNFDKIYLVCNL